MDEHARTVRVSSSVQPAASHHMSFLSPSVPKCASLISLSEEFRRSASHATSQRAEYRPPRTASALFPPRHPPHYSMASSFQHVASQPGSLNAARHVLPIAGAAIAGGVALFAMYGVDNRDEPVPRLKRAATDAALILAE